MSQPDLEFVRCGDCKAWRRINDQPKAPQKYCMLNPRTIVLGQPAGGIDGLAQSFHIAFASFVSIYPVHHRTDGCFYGVPK